MILWLEGEQNLSQGKEYADRLGLEMQTCEDINHAVHSNELCLFYNRDGLALCADGLLLRGDLTGMLPRLKRNNLLSEQIVKAAKVKTLGDCPCVLDATAGLGEDSLLLAAAGCQVTLCEYNPVIAALLEDSIRRASTDPVLGPIVSRMKVVPGDSRNTMAGLRKAPDVIVLDPMFPGRTKTGLIKKKFQLLQRLEQPCDNGEELIRAALAAHPKKILIKRPAKAEYLGGVKPSYTIEGSTIRYDVIVQTPV